MHGADGHTSVMVVMKVDEAVEEVGWKEVRIDVKFHDPFSRIGAQRGVAIVATSLLLFDVFESNQAFLVIGKIRIESWELDLWFFDRRHP